MTFRALKVRIRPTAQQQKLIDCIISCCRFICNHMLARNKKIYERRGEQIEYVKRIGCVLAKDYFPMANEKVMF